MYFCSKFCPWGENHRADMLIEDDDENLHRIQCKTGRVYKEGVLRLEPIKNNQEKHARWAKDYDLSKVWLKKNKKPVKGLEPPASGLQNRCSTTELHRHFYHNTLACN